MTDSRPLQQQTLLEQLADVLENQSDGDAGSLELRELVARMVGESRSWDDDLHAALIRRFGETHGGRYGQVFSGSFPSAYRARFNVAEALADIEQIQSIAVSTDVPMRFYQPRDPAEGGFHFKLYSGGQPAVLSDVIPIVENLGMRVLGEHPYRIRRRDGETFGVSDFSVELHERCRGGDLEAARDRIQAAFREIWNGFAENDDFNQLILLCNMGWREVALLRAYARYIKQLRFGFSQPFIAETLARYPDLTGRLVALFHARFDPDFDDPDHRTERCREIEVGIQQALESVETLDDDRILQRFFVLIRATLRTNYFQRGVHGEPLAYLSLKLAPADIPDIPQPRPRFEVFVYSPRVEGVHLRAGPVARGGIRWSDRVEDYRTEVLGLVKAQQVKNSVIVPAGAKGGFVVKQHSPEATPEQVRAEGVACYQTFIRGLLDITDNLEEGRVIAPQRVVRHDGDDPYLVVAADKGTATFSDIANLLAGEYGFWLGDAFASGGSEGYDHKKMGITARGAWESVRRHFLELGVDTQTDEFTVVGIGDMAGDVFGNGMLLSDRIRLVAAFNHRHIFIDPDPQAGPSFRERQRLFNLPGSSWADYDRSLISEGGGVFARSMKSIPVSDAMARVLGIRDRAVTPNELIRAILRAPVDLLWNGGIGTYVKAASETHEQVGDKANDGLRIDSPELRCKVLGEGGNLGVTQKGRIEFARRGGAANSDFIDNAGGVDCSDHEVNIKILMNDLVHQQRMTLAERNHMLRAMTDEVAGLVLANNYRQAMALSLAVNPAVAHLDQYERLMRRLESEGRLDRGLEFLPSDEELEARRERGEGLTRPELAVLVSYAKIELKQALAVSDIVREPGFSGALHSAFPPSLLAAFLDEINNHPLRAEVSATQIANDIVNRMGITWFDRMRSTTGADAGRIAAAYLISLRIHDVDAQWKAIEALDGQVDASVQADLYADAIRLVTRSASWLLQNRKQALDPVDCVAAYRGALADVLTSKSQLESVIPASRWQERYAEYGKRQVPDALSLWCASAESRYWLMDMVEIARQLNEELASVAWVYFTLGESLNLTWLDRQMRSFRANGHWQVLATIHFRDELDHQLRNLTFSVFSEPVSGEGVPQARLEAWRQDKRMALNRWQRMLSDMQAANEVDCAVFSVAHGVLRELAAKAG